MENDQSTFLVGLAKDLQAKARTAEEQVRETYKIARETGDPKLLPLADALSEKVQEIWAASRRAFQQVNKSGSTVDPEDIQRSLGCTLLAMKRWEAAFREFEASAGSNQSWRERVVQDAHDYISSHESYSFTKAWLKDQFETCRNNRDKSGSNDALAGMLLLVRQKYWSVGQDEGVQSESVPSRDMRLLVTPIAIEADAKLFPQVDGWEQGHALFQKYVPDMRVRIMTEIGVRVPGVRFRGNEGDLTPHSYIIVINEIPSVKGTVQPDRKFSPNYDEARLILEGHADQLQPVFNPLSGENDGAWIEEKYREDFELSGATLFDYFEYMTYHLEDVLRADLTPYVGVQEVHEIVREWLGASGDNEIEAQRRQELVRQILTDSTETVRFVQVLRGLVMESAPITELSAILESFQKQSGTAEVTSLVEAARLSIKDQLVGNSASFDFVYLSQAFEEEVNRWRSVVNGKVLFAIPPEEAQALLAAFRSGIDGRKQSGLVVVTRLPGIRPFFRRLIVLEFTRVVVLAADELRPDLHALVSNAIEYTPAVKTVT